MNPNILGVQRATGFLIRVPTLSTHQLRGFREIGLFGVFGFRARGAFGLRGSGRDPELSESAAERSMRPELPGPRSGRQLCFGGGGGGGGVRAA